MYASWIAGARENIPGWRRIHELYKERLGGLPGLTFVPEVQGARWNRWLTVILVDEKAFGASPAELRLALETENIEARPVWKPMHMQPVFKGCTMRGTGVAEDLFNRGLCLPSGTAMSENDVDRVCDTIRNVSGRSH